MLIEEYTRVGVSMLEAVEQTANLRARDPDVQPPAPGAKPVPSEAELARQNERAMRELQQQMENLGS